MESENVTQKGTELAASPGSAVLMATPRTDGQIYWNALPQLATSAEIVYASFARELERERNAFKSALMTIDEIYVDGCDTYEDWKSMGEIARAAIYSENDKLTHPERTPKQNENSNWKTTNRITRDPSG